jgi:hypothetical protein
MTDVVDRAPLEAFAEVMNDAGFDVRFPWECSLDDLEMHHYKTYRTAVFAAIIAFVEANGCGECDNHRVIANKLRAAGK